MITHHPEPRTLTRLGRAVALAVALLALPLTLTFAGGEKPKAKKSDHQKGDTSAKINAIAKKLRAAVKAGKLTDKQAKLKMLALKKMIAAKKGDHKKSAQLEKVGKRLKELVKAGKLTEKQAMAEWIALKKKLFGTKDDYKKKGVDKKKSLKKGGYDFKK